MKPSGTEPSPPRGAATGMRASGVITWVAALAPLGWRLASAPWLAREPRVALGVVAALVFGLGFLPRLRRAAGTVAAAGVLQVAAAACAVWCLPFTLPGVPTLALLCVVAVPQFALAGRDRLGQAIVLAQTVGLAVVYRPHLGGGVAFAVFVTAMCGLQAFAFAAARLAAREARGRAALERSLAELSAAQAVIAAGERLGERTRIARDLHDAVGHHLTTLSLHLDLARRQDADAARRTVETAHSICRVLLAELRDVLADVRGAGSGGELLAAIRDLLGRVPMLELRVELPDDLGDVDPECAHVLLRGVQELVTNALRHAGGAMLALEVRRDGARIVVVARDDGRGVGAPRAGGGLAGLAARVAQVGGSLRIESPAGVPGTQVELVVPARRGAA
ncbi:MAG: hypothetical protein IPM29_18490 [Planctomycetes bacterium]|nr:hypothetical protein [Planctomycetota bacterium]